MALATFGICAWIRFDLDFRVWVEQLDWYTYWYCMYVIWIAAAAEILVSFIGGLAVLRVSRDQRGILTNNVANT